MSAAAANEGSVRVWVLGLLALAGLLVCLGGALLMWSESDSYRQSPQVPGLRASVPLPMDVGFLPPVIAADPAQPGTFFVILPPSLLAARDHKTNPLPPLERRTYSFPSGERLQGTARAGVPVTPPVTFDFDGDGVEDEIGQLDPGHPNEVWVTSGATGAELFRFHDKYGRYSRHTRFQGPSARGIHDLDGDGCSELALVHPRMDRSINSWSLADRLFGPVSWVSIASYK